MRDLEPRAWRAVSAMGLAVVVVVVVGAVYLRPWLRPAPPPTPSVTPRPAVSVQQMQFLSAKLGWVVTGDPVSSTLFHTTDGGRHWQRQMEGISGYGWSLHFFDARHGVVYSTDRNGPALWQTRDGGQHWARSRLPSPTAPRLVFFADPDHGWCLVVLASAPVTSPIVDRQEVALFRTANGGATWSQVLATDDQQRASRGLGDDGQKMWIWFRDRSIGWIGQTTPGGQAVVYATTDGGDDWARQELPAPGGDLASSAALTEIAPPKALGHGGVALVVAGIAQMGGGWTLQGGSLFTWQPAAAAWAGPASLPTSSISTESLGVIDDRRWWAVNGPSVELTEDAGDHWRPAGQAPAGLLFVDLTVVDAANAWAILDDLHTCTPNCRTSLARTVDGGRHWSPVSSPAR